LLFTRTKHQARKLARQLTASGIPAVDLHGNLSQNARERNLEAFTTGAVRVLIATDIAARGIHVDDVDLVVHVDPPAEHKAYLHRSGRTARAGSGGTVVTIMLSEQRGDVRQLLRAAKISARPQPPAQQLVDALVGQVAPRVAPEHAPAAAARKPAPQGQRSGRKPRTGQPRGAGDRRRTGAGARGGAARNRRGHSSTLTYSTSSGQVGGQTRSGMQASWATVPDGGGAGSGSSSSRRKRRSRRADRPGGPPSGR